MDPNELEIGEALKNERNKKKSLFLIAGDEDRMIPYSHSQRIYDDFPGKKKIKIFEGTHNSPRPSSVIR